MLIPYWIALISINHLVLKCKYLICSRKRQPHLPPRGLLLGGVTLQHVESYRYLGVLVTRLNWSGHIEQICTKARKLVGILYRQFYSWADSNTLLLIYCTCIRLHLEYARLSVRRKYLKLTTMYNIVSGHTYFPSSQSNLPYQFIHTSTLNFIRPFAHTNYMYYSFVPSVVSSWNNLPDFVKLCSCTSCFKRSLLYHFEALGSY